MKKILLAVILTGIIGGGVLSACGNASTESVNTSEQAAETAEETKTETEPVLEETEDDDETADTCYENGRAYLYGLDGQEINYEAAYNNFNQALEKGKTEANFYLGILYDWCNYPETDYERAKSYYEAAGDNPYAQLALGFLYCNGTGVEQDTVKAKELFDAVIESGCADGYLGIAMLARAEEDYAAALEYDSKTVEEGQEQIFISNAMYALGYMYVNGFGVEQDYAKAMEWYGKAETPELE